MAIFNSFCMFTRPGKSQPSNMSPEASHSELPMYRSPHPPWENPWENPMETSGKFQRFRILSLLNTKVDGFLADFTSAPF